MIFVSSYIKKHNEWKLNIIYQKTNELKYRDYTAL